MATPWSEDSLLDAIKNIPDFSVNCPTLIQDISQQRLNLLTLVEYLRDVLTDPEPSQRVVGIMLLATVLQDLPKDFVREDELKFITAFFCDRLKDHHDVIPAALKGILSILQMRNIAKESPHQILSGVVMNLNCQGQRMEDRLVIYRILDLLVVPHISSLQALGPDLVYNIMTTIEGERDPRNLAFLFSMLPSLIKALSLGHLTEDFFEIMSCYYPVDFNPSSEQRPIITREQLASSLACVLTAIPDFADFLFPLVLEKLNSPIRLAKMDSLHLLIKAFDEFPPEKVEVHASPIWESLSREALSGSDYEVRESSRKAVTHLLRCLAELSTADEGRSHSMRLLLSDVVASSMSCLNEIQTTLFMPSADLLLAAAKSAPRACEYILKKVMPSIVDFIHTKNEAADRSIYLRIISRFLTVCKSFQVTPSSNQEITPQWNLLLQLYFSSAEHTSNLELKEALFGLTTLTPTFNSSERERLYNLLSTFVDRDCSTEVREQCRLCLCEIGNHFPSEVLESILPKILNLSEFDVVDSKFDRRMQAQCWLAALPLFTQKVLPNVIKIILESKHPHQIQASLSALRKLLQDIQGSGSPSHHVFESLNLSCNNTVACLTSWWMESIQNAGECDWVTNDSIRDDVCFIISNVTQHSSSQDQELILRNTLPLLRSVCANFDPSSQKHQQEVIYIFEAVFGCFYPHISVPEVRSLCSSLYKMSIGTLFDNVHWSSSRLSASLVNKMPTDILETTLSDLHALLQASCTQGSNREVALSASYCGWIVKALSMRGYTKLEIWIDMLIKYLGADDEVVAMVAAHIFTVIMGDSLTYLNLESHCTIRLLHKQRVFLCSLKMVNKSREAPPDRRYPYLVAVINTLTGVPERMLSNHIGEVLPMLLEALSQDDPHLIKSALDTLEGFLTQLAYHDSLRNHIQSLIPRLLPLTVNTLSMAIRQVALRCLYNIANFEVELLVPFKIEVLTQLSRCVGDSKRSVRQDAVAARSRWLSAL